MTPKPETDIFSGPFALEKKQKSTNKAALFSSQEKEWKTPDQQINTF
jgi:hypothetical protein